MKFTSKIVKVANNLTTQFGRPTATRIALKMFGEFAEYATVDPKLAEQKATAVVQAEIFGNMLNGEKRVFHVRFFAEKHGEVIGRDAVSVAYAIEKGFYTPVGGGERRSPKLLTYYDLTQNGVRSLKKCNFVSAE